MSLNLYSDYSVTVRDTDAINIKNNENIKKLETIVVVLGNATDNNANSLYGSQDKNLTKLKKLIESLTSENNILKKLKEKLINIEKEIERLGNNRKNFLAMQNQFDSHDDYELNLDEIKNTNEKIEELKNNEEKEKTEISNTTNKITEINQKLKPYIDAYQTFEKILVSETEKMFDKPQKGGKGKKEKYKNTEKKIENKCIYENKRGTKYVRVKGEYVLLSKYKKSKKL